MKIFKQYDVVVVPFPFTDKLASKRRPAVVLSYPDAVGQGRSILAMVTSSEHDSWPNDALILDIKTAGLTIPCRIRFKLFTVDHELIIRTLGNLSNADQVSVQKSIHNIFTLKSISETRL